MLDDILHQFIGTLSYHLQMFFTSQIHPHQISSIKKYQKKHIQRYQAQHLTRVMCPKSLHFFAASGWIPAFNTTSRGSTSTVCCCFLARKKQVAGEWTTLRLYEWPIIRWSQATNAAHLSLRKVVKKHQQFFEKYANVVKLLSWNPKDRGGNSKKIWVATTRFRIVGLFRVQKRNDAATNSEKAKKLPTSAT